MKILKIIDNPDGSSNMEFELTKEEIDFLVEYAILDILKKWVEDEKNGDIK